MSKLVHGFLFVVTWICQNWYMDFSKVDKWICPSCYMNLSMLFFVFLTLYQTKQSWVWQIFQSISKYLMPWVCFAFVNVCTVFAGSKHCKHFDFQAVATNPPYLVLFLVVGGAVGFFNAFSTQVLVFCYIFLLLLLFCTFHWILDQNALSKMNIPPSLQRWCAPAATPSK